MQSNEMICTELVYAMATINTSTRNRVPTHTAPSVNRRIVAEIEANRSYFQKHSQLIPQRLQALDREWDIERAIGFGWHSFGFRQSEMDCPAHVGFRFSSATRGARMVPARSRPAAFRLSNLLRNRTRASSPAKYWERYEDRGAAQKRRKEMGNTSRTRKARKH